jgi:hypothetical protein
MAAHHGEEASFRGRCLAATIETDYGSTLRRNAESSGLGTFVRGRLILLSGQTCDHGAIGANAGLPP